MTRATFVNHYPMKIFNEALRGFSDIAVHADYNEAIQFNTFQYNNANNGNNA